MVQGPVASIAYSKVTHGGAMALVQACKAAKSHQFRPQRSHVASCQSSSACTAHPVATPLPVHVGSRTPAHAPNTHTPEQPRAHTQAGANRQRAF